MSAEEFPAEPAAAHLLAMRRLGTLPIEFPDELRPRTLDDGYAVQAELLAQDPTHRLAGYKVACTTARAQERFGISSAVSAPITAAGIHSSGAQICGLDGETAFECEMAVRLEAVGGDVRIRSVVPTLEVIQQRYRGAGPDLFPTMLADGLYHAGCVLGEEVVDWQGLDLGSVTVRVVVDDVEVATGAVAATVGDPLHWANGLIEMVERRGGLIEDGFVVLTGSITGEHWIGAGQQLSADFGELGVVAASFG